MVTLLLALTLFTMPSQTKDAATLAPAFSATSMVATGKFIDLVESMRIAAMASEMEANAKIGNVKGGRHLKNVNDLIYGLQEELVSWPIRVASVNDTEVKLDSPEWLRISPIAPSEPWMKKLRKGDLVTLNATIKRVDLRQIEMTKSRFDKKRYITIFLEETKITTIRK